MKKTSVFIVVCFLLNLALLAEGYKVGDKAANFRLKDVSGKYVSLNDYPNAKGFIVVFTCNHCPYAQAYQDRIMALDRKYSGMGYPVIAISSSDPGLVPEDSYDKMVTRAKEKDYTFPYLFDENQVVMHQYGAQRTPHVFVLSKSGSDLTVQYIGAIDDNFQDPSKVTSPYVANAVDALLAGRTPEPSFTKAIGCGIKEKNPHTD